MLVLRIIFIIVDKAGIATEGASESGSWCARLLRGNTQIDWNQLTRMMPQADSWRCPRGPSLLQWHEAHPSLSQVQIRLQRMCVYVCAQCIESTNNHWYLLLAILHYWSVVKSWNIPFYHYSLDWLQFPYYCGQFNKTRLIKAGSSIG